MSTNVKKVWVYDIEQFKNYHCCTFKDRDNPLDIRQFVICESRNDIDAYYKFLKEEVAGLIGFNNVNFDYPLLHTLMHLMKGYQHGIVTPDPKMINILLKEDVDRILKEDYSSVPENEVLIPQLDLYRIHHFDNKAKHTSLKAVEIAINFHNVQDIPFDEDHLVEPEEIQLILDYNLNDVEATYQFYLLTKDMIELRKKLGNKYNINLRNANDPKIGQEIFGRQIAIKKGWSYRYIKDMRTYRHYIDLKDCILPYIYFNSKEFNELLEDLKSTVIETTYNAFEKSVIYKGFKYDYGTGGIHGCIEPGIYDADDEYTIVDIDVKSYYPNLAIVNRFYPQHLGPEFVDVYEELFEERMKAQKEGDQATNSGLKLALNGVYGKSNDKFSLFYDPKYTMQITINGQLLLSILAETLVDNIKDLTMLQINTDGVTVKIKRTDKDLLLSFCKRWEEMTRLTLEYAEYKKMVIRDVNNYLAVTVEGKVKPKGCFEITPMQNGAVAYNKDWSMRVVPKALHAYYLEGIPIEDFITSHTHIYDFCLGFRARSDWEIWREFIENGDRFRERQQRTIRYYISKKGNTLLKINREDRREILLNVGKVSTLFNRYVEEKKMEEYEIDYSFYISEANKIKNAVYSGQLKLF